MRARLDIGKESDGMNVPLLDLKAQYASSAPSGTTSWRRT
jgi:hypothetical protein